MRIEPVNVLKSIAFVLVTLAATGVLVAAGLAETAPLTAAAIPTDQAPDASRAP